MQYKVSIKRKCYLLSVLLIQSKSPLSRDLINSSDVAQIGSNRDAVRIAQTQDVVYRSALMHLRSHRIHAGK